MLRQPGCDGFHFTFVPNGQMASIPSFMLCKPNETPWRKPTDLTANANLNSVELSWTENSTTPATAWVVAYKTGDADFTEVSANSNPFILTGLTPETTYKVKVRPATDEVEKWSSAPVTSIEAGKPYIIRWSKAADYVDDNDHNIWQPSGATIGACRAYFKLKGLSASDVSTTRLFFGEVEETTSLPQPLQREGSQAGAWYTLDGRKLDGKPAKKGVYINNGVKVVIK